jgi:hypothetical protein
MEDQEFVGSYADHLRVGGRLGMMTDIEGTGRLAVLQRKRERMDPETRMYETLENSYYSMKGELQLQDVDLLLLKDALQNCPNKLYKNIVCVIIAYVYLTNRTFSIDRLVDIARVHNHSDCTEIAIVRYSRLMKTLI